MTNGQRPRKYIFPQGQPMNLIDEQGQPRFGRWRQPPTRCNFDDYRNGLLPTQGIRAWRRRVRLKRFSFVAIQHPRYHIGMAVVQLGWAGHGFFYVYDRSTGQGVSHQGLQPFTRHSHIADPFAIGVSSHFRHRQIEIDSVQHPHHRTLTVRRQGQTLCAVQVGFAPQQQSPIAPNQHSSSHNTSSDTASHHTALNPHPSNDSAFPLAQLPNQPLYLCTPTGIRGMTFTHKSMCLPVSGVLTHAGEQIDLDIACLASIDDTAGFLRPETEWYWLSVQGVLDGQRIGLNLASGVNESVSNENALWIDGELFALPDVLFWQTGEQHWHIYSLDGAIELQVRTGWGRQDNTHLGLAVSQFGQWQAQVSGHIRLVGHIEHIGHIHHNPQDSQDRQNNQGKQPTTAQEINFSAVAGIFEQHFARW